MKLTVQQSQLKKMASAVLPAVATKATIPALSCIHMLTEGCGTVTLLATDLEKSIKVSFTPDNIEEQGAILIPARLFNELISATPNEKVTISTNGDKIKYKYGKSVSDLRGLDAEQFPLVASAEDAEREWDARQLAEAISLVAFFAATDESRPVLTGVLLEYKDGTLTLASADGFRLSMHSTSVSISQPNFRVIVPARSLMELVKLLGEGGKVGISANENRVIFTMEQSELVATLIDGSYPDVKQIMPKDADCVTNIRVNRATLKAAVQKCQIFARDGANIIRVLAEGGEVTLKGRGQESGENVETIEATIDGPTMEAAFNGKYLLEALSAVSCESVELRLKSMSSPALLRGVGVVGWSHVLMPMHLQQGQGEQKAEA